MSVKWGLNDIIQVTILQSMDAQVLMNTMEYKVTSLGTAFELDQDIVGPELFTHLYGANTSGNWAHQMLLCQTNALTHTRLWAQKVYPQRQRRFEGTAGFAGLISGTPMPTNVACTITKYTDTAKRSGIGSMHLGGVPAAAVTNSFITSTHVTKLQALGAELVKQLTIGLAGWQIQPGLQNVRLPNSTWKPINQFAVQITSRVERRRTVGLGI